MAARSQTPTGGERRLPPPIEVRPEPEVALEDPTFEPLPGAGADFGRLGGAVYQIEVPDNWNGKLVLDMHGYGELASETSVGPRRTGSFSGYLLAVAGPEAIAECARGATLTFRVNGRPAVETVVNEPGRRGLFDLTLH